MRETLLPGATGEARYRVVSENLVSHHNPKGPAVLASPWVLSMMEHAAYNAIQPHLDEGEQSVGVGFDFRHLAPTPAGAQVVATAEVSSIEGMMVTLTIEARDEHELVAQGTHVRAVIEMARFRKRLERKTRG
jgi:fluoroacetyl-CoA thioesterase